MLKYGPSDCITGAMLAHKNLTEKLKDKQRAHIIYNR